MLDQAVRVRHLGLAQREFKQLWRNCSLVQVGGEKIPLEAVLYIQSGGKI